MECNIKGIVVGCDDEDVGGYEWVINHNDFDNSNPEIINKLEKYKNIKDFKIYFYVFKTPTEEPARTSDEYRGTIFGRAEIKKVERNKNDPEKYKYVHHVKIKNFEPFELKIKLEDIEGKLEKYGWTEDQKSNFGVNLSHHGLLLTEKDCNLINKLVLKDSVNIKKVNKMNNVDDMKLEKRGTKMKNIEDFDSSDNAGLLIGYHISDPMKRGGFEYVLDHCEESARTSVSVLSYAEKMKGTPKRMYFFIWEKSNKNSKKHYENSYFSKVHGGDEGIFGKIFGEGIIDDVFQEYLFSWDVISGNNVAKLRDFLIQYFGATWIRNAKFEKINDGRTIKVSTNKNYLMLMLNNKKTKVNLKIDDVRTDELIAKMENNKLNVYKNYITYKYVLHYRNYIDIEEVKMLSKRIKSNSWTKSIIRFGLPLTKEECDQISKMAGVM